MTAQQPVDLLLMRAESRSCETVIGHHKTDMGEGQPALRSGDPEGVIQEMWALFAVYQAICKIVGITVTTAGISPDKISFPHALAAATDTIAAFLPDQTDLALGKAADFPAGNPASPASSTSPGGSSSTCSTPGKSPKTKAIGPCAFAPVQAVGRRNRLSLADYPALRAPDIRRSFRQGLGGI